MLELVATFACGVFFGAAAYISIVQHPAALEAGVTVATKLFPPMCRRGAVMQASLAAIALAAVVPFTLVVVRPVNDRLLTPLAGGERGLDDPRELLRRWAALHAARTALSGLAFLLMLAQFL